MCFDSFSSVLDHGQVKTLHTCILIRLNYPTPSPDPLEHSYLNLKHSVLARQAATWQQCAARFQASSLRANSSKTTKPSGTTWPHRMSSNFICELKIWPVSSWLIDWLIDWLLALSPANHNDYLRTASQQHQAPVKFSSRQCLCARESPYALHTISQEFPQCCLWNSSNVGLIDNGPFS